jgi:RND family efflux transporter MFP subunit
MKHRVMMLSSLALALAGCGGTHEPRKADAADLPPVPVSIIETRSTEWPAWTEVAGTVRATTSTTLASRVMGYIREMKVNPGDRVSTGQLLVTIDARDLEAGLLHARAVEQEALSGVAEAENGIAAAKAQLSLAQVTFKRMDDLFNQKSISNQEFDEAQARFRTAEANYQMALSKRSQTDAKIAQARQAVASASVARSYSEIRAPFAGIVTEKRAEAGQMATPGAPLLTIEQNKGFRVEAPVEESALGDVRLGQSVPVLLGSASEPVPAKITEIVPAIDPGSRSFLIKATLPHTPTLRTGSFARVRIPKGTRSSILIPADAISQRGDLQSVYVLDGNIARLRMVTSGQRLDSRVEILSGLREAEKVVYPRPASIRDGIRVEVR